MQRSPSGHGSVLIFPLRILNRTAASRLQGTVGCGVAEGDMLWQAYSKRHNCPLLAQYSDKCRALWGVMAGSLLKLTAASHLQGTVEGQSQWGIGAGSPLRLLPAEHSGILAHWIGRITHAAAQLVP